ncbi:tetraspanin-31-like [Daphnia pulex]|uniref:tetraspanin-31-like n=1 Tax=Daphnia pulex TaxID=6669 RepID=UPI001EDCC1C0|nr:tetraspanin-31-like [Daphnia pulex]XP_046439267.1 tetraspanin-31-like [Daphnia pulex]
MCGGFKFSKNALIALNILYILVGFILIGVATYGKAANLVTSLPIIGGIVACGIFLLVIAIMGLIGAVKHHQVLLFFYMVVLFILFVIQFAIACACLAVNSDTQKTLAVAGWNSADNATKTDVQNAFNCCGFHNTTDSGTECADKCPTCLTCESALENMINYGFRVSGGIGLFFSFTELVGFSVAYRFRHMAAGMNEVQ